MSGHELETHNGRTSRGTRTHRATCICGWVGPVRFTAIMANMDWTNHADEHARAMVADDGR